MNCGIYIQNPWRVYDAQVRKERMEADIIVKRNVDEVSKYTVVLDHLSETAIWTIWKATHTGRWYGVNDLDGRVIDAPTLASAKLDLRLCYFVGNETFAKAESSQC